MFELLENIKTESVKKDDSESECDESDATINYKRKKPVKRLWVKKSYFSTAELARKYIKSIRTWKICALYDTLDGHKIMYQCTAREHKKTECSARIYLLFHCESPLVSLYESMNDPHNHSDKTHSLSNSTELQKHNIQEPDSLKLKKLGLPTASINAIQKWCCERICVPIEDDELFVLDFNIRLEPLDTLQDLKIVVSTKRLLQNVNKNECVQTDTLHKLIWYGYNVFIVGSSDEKETFHPFAIAICSSATDYDFAFIFDALRRTLFKIYSSTWKPKYLLADGSDAIINGFRVNFGLPDRIIMCYQHLIKDIDSYLSAIELKNEIRSDIGTLYLCINDETFDIVSELFLKKWNDKSDPKITSFLQYFKTVWLQKNRYWYRAANDFLPSTNKSLESTISVIKTEQIFRERLPVKLFLEVLENNIVEKWSNEYDPKNPNYKYFHDEPKYSIQMWKESYKWANLEKEFLEEKNGKSTNYFFSSNENDKLTTEELYLCKSRFLTCQSFDEYKNDYSIRLWKVCVTFNNDSFVSICMCPIYLKRYICKHSLGMLIRLGKEEVPNKVKNSVQNKKSLLLSQNCKRDRPDRSKKALLIQ